jgi:hypothetical protein
MTRDDGEEGKFISGVAKEWMEISGKKYHNCTHNESFGQCCLYISLLVWKSEIMGYGNDYDDLPELEKTLMYIVK